MSGKIITSKPPRIFFDASVSDFNVVGIGIYEMMSGEKTTVTIQSNKIVSSNDAEEMAFKRALQFAINTFDSKQLFLFTDNRGVYLNNRHIVEAYTHNGYTISLNWVPRELNTEADKLSKLASSRGSVTGCNKIEKVIEKELFGTPITDGLAEFIRSKPLENRLKMVKNLFRKPIQLEAYDFFIAGKGSKSPNPKDVELKSMALFISTVINTNKERKKFPRLIPFLTIYRTKGSPKNSCPTIKDKELEQIIRIQTTTRSK